MAVKYGYLEETDFSNIADAIREKNGETTTYKPNEMPAAIRAISTGDADTSDATASASDILTGKTAYVNGTKVTGTITELGATTYSPSDTAQSISAGQYISGDQTIEAVTADNIPSSLKEGKTVTAPLTGTTAVTPTTGKVLTGVTVSAPDTTGTATASDILDTKTAYVNGVQVTGTIVGISAKTYSPSTTNQTINSGYYLSGDQTIEAVTADNIPSSLKETKTVTAPLTGTTAVTPTTGKVLTGVTVSAPDTTGTATASDILTGKTAYVNGTQVTGSMVSNTTINETIVPGGSTTINSGYYSANGSVSASLAASSDQIDSTLKSEGTSETIVPGGSTTILSGYYYTSDSTISASLAASSDQIADTAKEGKTVTAPLTGTTAVTPTTGKVLTSVTVNAPDMSSADATADDIVSGKKAYGSDGTLITGTHEEASGTDTSDATATAADILSGKTAYISDGKTTGTLEVLNYYSSTAEPTSDIGEVGELYIKLES